MPPLFPWRKQVVASGFLALTPLSGVPEKGVKIVNFAIFDPKFLQRSK